MNRPSIAYDSTLFHHLVHRRAWIVTGFVSSFHFSAAEPKNPIRFAGFHKAALVPIRIQARWLFRSHHYQASDLFPWYRLLEAQYHTEDRQAPHRTSPMHKIDLSIKCERITS